MTDRATTLSKASDPPPSLEDLLARPDLAPEVRAVFDDIRVTRGDDFICNFWRALADRPDLLAGTWAETKRAMTEQREGGLTPPVKELIYLAVSIANGCVYCVHQHTEAARRHGMTEAQYADLVAIVAIASQTNTLAKGMRVPIDDDFLPTNGG